MRANSVSNRKRVFISSLHLAKRPVIWVGVKGTGKVLFSLGHASKQCEGQFHIMV